MTRDIDPSGVDGASWAPPEGVTVDAATIDYLTLRTANEARQLAWDEDNQITLAYRGNEFAGEAGEVCNVIKKLERERMGIRGSRDTVEHLAEELADTVICADLIAMQAGIDLDAAVANKFNATSAKVGLPQRLRTLSAAHGEAVAWRELADKATALERSLEVEGAGVNAFLRDDIEQAISAMRALSPASLPLDVKVLGWFKDASYNLTATCVVGTYHIQRPTEASGEPICLYLNQNPLGEYPTVEQAKAAAQADFNARILSALEPSGISGELPIKPIEPEIISEAFPGYAFCLQGRDGSGYKVSYGFETMEQGHAFVDAVIAAQKATS